MHKKVLVSLVSTQTIRNIQLIKEFEVMIDDFIFITTERMEQEDENRTDWMIKALQLPYDKIHRILVSPFIIDDIKNELKIHGFDKDNEYIVNLTCGTKLMAIATMEFFKKFETARFYYVPRFGASYVQVYPEIDGENIPFEHRITMYEHLSAYGFKIESRESLHKPKEETEKLMQKVLNCKANIDELPEIKNAQKFKANEDKKYYSGGWFEEYLYSKIKSYFKLKDKEIAMGVKLQNRFTKNEYDVVFVKDNTVYVMECKAYFGQSKLKAKIEKDLYKLSALDDDFGIKARSIYATTIDMGANSERENQSLQYRAKDLGVKIIHFDDFLQGDYLKKL